jgi:hypothetical protein
MRIIDAMPALAELDPTRADALQDVLPHPEAAAEVTEAPAGGMSAEGAVPDVGPNGQVVEPGKTASEQAFGDKPTAQSGEIDGGMFVPEEYQAACIAAGTPDKWDDKYFHGNTAAKQWNQPWEGRYDNTFTLKSGHSASQALKDFIAGPTLADWRTLAVAVEMNEVRDTIGDEKFDKLFGSSNGGIDAQVPHSQRLTICQAMYTTPFASHMEMLAEQDDDAIDHAEEAEAPAVAAQVEDKPLEGGVTAQPAPELIAEELGIEREQELA